MKATLEVIDKGGYFDLAPTDLADSTLEKLLMFDKYGI